MRICRERLIGSHRNTTASAVVLKFLIIIHYKSRVKITVRAAHRMLIIVFAVTARGESPPSLLMDVCVE